MGERTEVKVVDRHSTVYLYYLARIIFSEMIRDDIDGTTGYGISSDGAGEYLGGDG